MGSVETDEKRLIIYSHIITYGNAANEVLTEMMRDEIETMWNEPKAVSKINDTEFTNVWHPDHKDINLQDDPPV